MVPTASSSARPISRPADRRGMTTARRLLDDIVQDAPGVRVRQRIGAANPTVDAITHDSRLVSSGSIFACIRGEHFDGHSFARVALTAGAPALLVDHRLDVDAPQVVVDDTRLAIGPLSDAVYGHPSAALRMVGVTGTNGKTTTTWILQSILEQAGLRVGLIGTLSGAHTTPEAPEIQARLRGFVNDGFGAVAMEVSSHALALHRVDGTVFDVVVFTNLSRDHLDLHGTEERYFAAKARLFERTFAPRAVVNGDDLRGRLLADVAAGVDVRLFTMADAVDLVVTASQARFIWRGRPVVVPLGGRFNVANALAAATAAEALGLPIEVIVAGLAAVSPVPGRFELIVVDDRDFAVVVDYAHTPDALAEVLSTARQSASSGRVIVVFGCGGDRDATKRPLMGAVAADGADLVLVTSDNPRHEDPGAIISAVISGVPDRASGHVSIEPDRRAAIFAAVAAARSGDVVVIAGKGHETTQTIGDVAVPFDDRDVARLALAARR